MRHGMWENVSVVTSQKVGAQGFRIGQVQALVHESFINTELKPSTCKNSNLHTPLMMLSLMRGYECGFCSEFVTILEARTYFGGG